MSDPNAGATPQSLSDAEAGTDGNGVALPWRKAAMLFTARMFGLGKDYAFPEAPNVSTSVFDQVTTLAKLQTRTALLADGNTYDIYDMLRTCTKYVLSQNIHINDDEVNSVNYKAPKAGILRRIFKRS